MLLFDQKKKTRKNKQVLGDDDGGHCVWYGECYSDIHKKNCPYNGPAQRLNNEGQKLLAKRCPHLLVDHGKGIYTCCDVNQLKTLDTNVNIASNFLKRCPSCLDNLVKHICDFTCAVNQSKFMNVTETAEAKGNYSHFISPLFATSSRVSSSPFFHNLDIHTRIFHDFVLLSFGRRGIHRRGGGVHNEQVSRRNVQFVQ